MLSLIQHNPYLTLLIVTTLEWPIATFVSAGLAAHGLLRLEYVIIITILGDALWDIALYLIGRYFHQLPFVHRIIQHLPNKSKLSNSFHQRPLLYMILGKFTPYLATPTLIFAWLHQMELVKFIGYSLIISTLVKASYIILWYLGAVSVQQIEGFLAWRAQIVSYIIVWGMWLWIAHQLYTYIGVLLKKEIKS